MVNWRDIDEYNMEWLMNDASRMSRQRAVFEQIARHSIELENGNMDQWELLTDTLINAYDMGRDGADINAYHFLKWHGAILPYGGTLRQCNPISVGMGESFQPAPCRELSPRMMALLQTWSETMRSAGDPYYLLAHLHFAEWCTHFFPDGNKRHCRLLTVYGCGRLGVAPIDIDLLVKARYIDALANADVTALARLFEDCTIRE